MFLSSRDTERETEEILAFPDATDSGGGPGSDFKGQEMNIKAKEERESLDRLLGNLENRNKLQE